MPTRRQIKVARVIKEVVSDAVANQLSDPRIEGLVSVTRVDAAPNLRAADVYLSIFGKNETSQNKTFMAITHARSRIQSLLANRLECKFCPILHFYIDEKFKKTMEIMNLIEQAASEFKEKDASDQEEEE
ncbi:MAG: 30S ribosome-binding factor RbfA [Planctomycetes bacterium]|nr:30S ribosome-binding factor RbfA [Planctomycetota bacterium]